MIRVRAENNKTRKFRELPLHGHLVEQAGLMSFGFSILFQLQDTRS